MIGWSTWLPPLEITNQIFYCGNLRFPVGESVDSRCTSWKCHFQPWKLQGAPLLLIQPTLIWWASARIYSYFIDWSFLQSPSVLAADQMIVAWFSILKLRQDLFHNGWTTFQIDKVSNLPQSFSFQYFESKKLFHWASNFHGHLKAVMSSQQHKLHSDEMCLLCLTMSLSALISCCISKPLSEQTEAQGQKLLCHWNLLAMLFLASSQWRMLRRWKKHGNKRILYIYVIEWHWYWPIQANIYHWYRINSTRLMDTNCFHFLSIFSCFSSSSSGSCVAPHVVYVHLLQPHRFIPNSLGSCLLILLLLWKKNVQNFPWISFYSSLKRSGWFLSLGSVSSAVDWDEK